MPVKPAHNSTAPSPTPSQSAPQRSRWSITLRVALGLYLALLSFGTHSPWLSVPVDPTSGIEVLQLDKIAHYTGFAGLTALLILARPFGWRRDPRLTALLAAVLAVAYAAANEWSQQFVGRNSNVPDFIANLMGVLTAYLMALAMVLPRWRPTPLVYLSRSLWLLFAPTLLLISVLPEGGPTIRWVLGMELLDGRSQGELHFYGAMLLTWMLGLASPAGRSRAGLSVAVAVLAMIAAGPAIELIQYRTGRHYNVNDVYAHMQGMTVALLVWAGFSTLRGLVQRPAGGEAKG